MLKTNILIPIIGKKGDFFCSWSHPFPKKFVDLNGKTLLESMLVNFHEKGMHFIFCISNFYIEDYGVLNLISRVAKELGFTYDVLVVGDDNQSVVEACLFARDFIDSKDPLIITRYDQIIEDWDFSNFQMECDFSQSNGAVGIFASEDGEKEVVTTDKRDWVVKVHENKKVSDSANCGVCWWKNGSDFVSSASKMIEMEDRVDGKFHISLSFNYMIDSGAKICAYYFKKRFLISNNEELQTYLKKDES